MHTLEITTFTQCLCIGDWMHKGKIFVFWAESAKMGWIWSPVFFIASILYINPRLLLLCGAWTWSFVTFIKIFSLIYKKVQMCSNTFSPINVSLTTIWWFSKSYCRSPEHLAHPVSGVCNIFFLCPKYLSDTLYVLWVFCTTNLCSLFICFCFWGTLLRIWH